LSHILELNHPERASHTLSYLGVDLSEKLLDQARASHQKNGDDFVCADMRDTAKYVTHERQAYFFIASFHHLVEYSDRVGLLRDIHAVAAPDARIYMTNWHLLSPKNAHYGSSITTGYPDGSADFMIKIGGYARFYHAFSSAEYAQLAGESGWHIERLDW
jgi:hypothetical protein